jgi:hypothetical protein
MPFAMRVLTLMALCQKIESVHFVDNLLRTEVFSDDAFRFNNKVAVHPKHAKIAWLQVMAHQSLINLVIYDCALPNNMQKSLFQIELPNFVVSESVSYLLKQTLNINQFTFRNRDIYILFETKFLLHIELNQDLDAVIKSEWKQLDNHRYKGISFFNASNGIGIRPIPLSCESYSMDSILVCDYEKSMQKNQYVPFDMEYFSYPTFKPYFESEEESYFLSPVRQELTITSNQPFAVKTVTLNADSFENNLNCIDSCRNKGILSFDYAKYCGISLFSQLMFVNETTMIVFDNLRRNGVQFYAVLAFYRENKSLFKVSKSYDLTDLKNHVPFTSLNIPEKTFNDMLYLSEFKANERISMALVPILKKENGQYLTGNIEEYKLVFWYN